MKLSIAVLLLMGICFTSAATRYRSNQDIDGNNVQSFIEGSPNIVRSSDIYFEKMESTPKIIVNKSSGIKNLKRCWISFWIK
uniref:CSON011809 protein n=1 Tax=Culicoides sonorensis TaxID=179676 RepID=A0A336N2V4_CULSO